MVKFGNLLAELRQDKRMTQAQLAQVMFVTAGTISNYEKGIHFPDVEKLLALADYFEVTVDYLLGRTDSNVSMDILQERITPQKTVGQFIEDFQRITPERKKALLLIMHDMQSGMMLAEYNKKEAL